MSHNKKFSVLSTPDLSWPSSLELPTKRFRLFVAADSLTIPVLSISAFAKAALNAGMVYCCAWGQGCERFHDVVDECINEDNVNAQRFVGTTPNDVVMTTWHDKDSLDEALEFFALSAIPTDGFSDDIGFRLVICVGHPDWAASARRFLQAASL